MTFNECFNKYFSAANSLYSLTGREAEKTTLMLLSLYDGSYDLSEENLGALIMHVRLGNITGCNLQELFKKLNYLVQFEHDVLNNLRN